MMLMTQEITKKAQQQYPLGSDMDKQMIVAKFFTPWSNWTWYLMNQDPEDPNYLWGIVKGFEVEIGSFRPSEGLLVSRLSAIGILSRCWQKRCGRSF